MVKATSPLGWHLDCRPGFSDYGSVLCHGHLRNGGVLLFEDRLLAHCVGHQKSKEERMPECSMCPCSSIHINPCESGMGETHGR